MGRTGCQTGGWTAMTPQDEALIFPAEGAWIEAVTSFDADD
jgi:hypothetical protein